MTNPTQSTTIYISESNYLELAKLIADYFIANHLALDIDSNHVRLNLAKDIVSHIRIDNALNNNSSINSALSDIRRAGFTYKTEAERYLKIRGSELTQWVSDTFNIELVREASSSQATSESNQQQLNQLIQDIAQAYADELATPTVMQRLENSLTDQYSDSPERLESALTSLNDDKDRNWSGRSHTFDFDNLTQAQSAGIVAHFIASDITSEQSEFHPWLSQILSDQGSEFEQTLAKLRQQHLLTDQHLGLQSQAFTNETGLTDRKSTRLNSSH